MKDKNMFVRPVATCSVCGETCVVGTLPTRRNYYLFNLRIFGYVHKDGKLICPECASGIKKRKTRKSKVNHD